MRDGNKDDCEITNFNRFIYWRLWPIIASEKECVRNILRAIDFLPNSNQQRAADALVLYVEEMKFNIDMYNPSPGYFD